MIRFAIISAALIAAMPARAHTLGQRLNQLPPEEYIFQGLNIADKALTNHCLREGRCEERNPILGHNPSTGELIAAGAVEGAAHAAVTMMLQERAPRLVKAWEMVSISVGAGVVAWNIRVCFH